MFELTTISGAMKMTYDSEAVLIDVRDKEAYRDGHLPMAVHVPLDDILNEKYEPDPSKAVILYCDTGSSSLLAAKKLDQDGVKAYSINGGIMFYKGYLEKAEKKLWTMVLPGQRMS